MRYFYNKQISSTIAMSDKANMRIPSGFKEVSLLKYNEVNHFDYSPVEEVVIDVEDEEVELEEITPAEDVDILEGFLSDTESEVELEEDGEVEGIEINASVASHEEAVSSNDFTSIATLRDQADTSREARVVKGKAHGVYTYDETSDKWNKTGEI